MLCMKYQKIAKIRKPPLAILPAESEDESEYVGGVGIKIVIPTKIIDVYTRLEV